MSKPKFSRDIGSRVAEFRHKAGLTQAQLGLAVNVSQPRLAMYETGKRGVPVELLIPLAEVLRVTVDDLLAVPAEQRRKTPGPPSKLEKQFLDARKLPKSEQEFISKLLDRVLVEARTE